MSSSPPRTPPARRLGWHDPGVRSAIYQVLAVGIVALAIWFLISNLLHNLSSRHITTGFAFLHREAGFDIGQTLVAYTPASTYGRAIWIGILNTLLVSVLGVVFSTLLGTLVGIGRLSRNWLIAKLAMLYVEAVRNVPLLLQLFFWYSIITEGMPGPRQAHRPLPGVFLSNRGLKVPALHGESAGWMLLGLVLALAGIAALHYWGRRRQQATGRPFALGRWALALIVTLPFFGWLVSGRHLVLQTPVLRGFNFAGGWTLSPELAALLLGLVVYTTAFTAEVVRSGIQAVDVGQWEAAGSLGLRRALVLRLVVLPQALRVIVPPMTSQYLNLAKNSSLAVAIGYPDIVSILDTTINQTGQAIEGVLLIMAAYLTVSLTISFFMNWYNRRVALVER
ncbi:amino acid ABC transporter permease [Bordetella sp. FB-8]|uniref:amino acid ABC transporter permease n=1 Tax=Bordetella sp. FB-8 TaxID=1159870 RepID=UPI0003719848|nr:amino acid ABC transporter permease [Bordetella sp. FB-8]